MRENSTRRPRVAPHCESFPSISPIGKQASEHAFLVAESQRVAFSSGTPDRLGLRSQAGESRPCHNFAPDVLTPPHYLPMVYTVHFHFPTLAPRLRAYFGKHQHSTAGAIPKPGLPRVESTSTKLTQTWIVIKNKGGGRERACDSNLRCSN